jgi:hypothetical protein
MGRSYFGRGTLATVPAPDKALGLVDQVRRKMIEISQRLTAAPVTEEVAVELAAELGQLADQLGRVQGLLTTGEDPLGGTYRTQIAALRRWLRARDLSPDPPISSEHVLEWLSEQRGTYAPSSVRKSVAAVRSWHRAEGLADPTETDEIKQLIAGLGDPGDASSEADVDQAVIDDQASVDGQASVDDKADRG